jgi:hypothetical protein
MRMIWIAAMLLLARPLWAQGGAAEVDCDAVLAATLASGSEAVGLEACAPRLVAALADAIRNAGAERDVEKLLLLNRVAAGIRDPAVFDAALALGASAAAEPAARVLGLWVALQLAEPGTWFDGAFERPVSERCEEAGFVVGEHGGSPVDNGLMADAEGRLRDLAQSIVINEAEPLTARRFARCVVLLLPDADPPSYEVPDWPQD